MSAGSFGPGWLQGPAGDAGPAYAVVGATCRRGARPQRMARAGGPAVHRPFREAERSARDAHVDRVGLPDRTELDGLARTRGVDLQVCLLYTSDAADDLLCVDLG